MIRKIDAARILGADPSLITRWCKRGMPLDSAEAAMAWRDAFANRRVRSAPAAAAPAPAPATDPVTKRTPAPKRPLATESTTSTMHARILAARCRREEAEALHAERRALEQAGALVRVEDVDGEYVRHLIAAREIALSLPSRLAPVLAAESDPGAIHARLDEELRRLLHELARA